VSVGFVVRCLTVTVAAAVVSCLPAAIWLTIGMDANMALIAAFELLPYSLVACALIGLPISLILFWKLDQSSLSKLLVLANLVGGLVVALTFGLGHAFGAILIGVPSLLAANAFALFGWLLVVPRTSSAAND
jgi:hypothetical protein